MNQRLYYLLGSNPYSLRGGGAVARNPGTTKPAAVPTASTDGRASSAGSATNSVEQGNNIYTTVSVHYRAELPEAPSPTPSSTPDKSPVPDKSGKKSPVKSLDFCLQWAHS